MAADVQLEADGIVTGTVRDANDAPLAGVPVVLSITGLIRETSTDGSGAFMFEHVKLGAFQVQAQVGPDDTPQFVAASGTPESGAP